MMNCQNKDKKAVCVCLIFILVTVAGLSGCATSGNKVSDSQPSKVEEAVSDHKETLIGATLLGILGAVVGAAVGGEKGAAIGGGVGLAAGAGMGQVLEHKDKKRTEAVSEAGNRPELEETVSVVQDDSRTGSIELPPPTGTKQVVAVAQGVTSKPVSAAVVPHLVNDTPGVEGVYSIVRDGRVVGSISLHEDKHNQDALFKGSLLLCQDPLSNSCARLELRKH